MSLEQSLSKKLTLSPGGTQDRAKSPSSTDSSPKSSPSKSAKGRLSLKGLRSSTIVGGGDGPSSDSIKRSRSPLRRQQTLGVQDSSSSGKKDKNKQQEGSSSSVSDLGEFIPGTSGLPGVDHSPFDPSAGASSGKSKILSNWKSACGRTKDRTKDFIRRWKTLPENHPDFDQIQGNQSPSQGGSSGNITGGSSVSPQQHHATPAGGGGPESGTNSGTTSSSGCGSGNATSSAGMAFSSSLISTASGGSSSGLGGKLKNLGKKCSESDRDIPCGTSGGANSTSGLASSLATSTKTSLAGGGGGGGGNSFFTNGPMRRQQTIDDNSMQVDGAGGGKSSTGWSVHVWATYVQRDNDDVTFNEETKPGRELLSEFQKVKLTHFFRHVLDMNHDDVISAEDFVALNQRIRHYIEWSSECIEFHILKEVHSGFLECFLNQPLDDSSVMYYCSSERETRQHVNIDEWLDVWGELLNSARTMESLPLWLQYFPKILFQVINKSGSGTISKEQLRAFYTMFLGIDFRVVNDTLDSIYDAMTDGGRNKITYSLFKLCFANFLLGKYPHGPGQYLFGICAPATLNCAFPIDYSALNTPKDDLEPYDPDKDKGQSNRRSVIV